MKTATARTAVTFRNILFATDFSPAAAHAIPYVKKVAKHYEANLFALYVRPPAVNPMTPPAYWPDDRTIEQQNEKYREQLLDTFEGISTTAIVEEGDILGWLRDSIAKNNIDLVVIGTHGRGGLGKMLLGSVAEEVIRTLTCPVLTVGPNAKPMRSGGSLIPEILYATDLASPSPAAAAYAVSLAQQFQANLAMLHVVAEPKAGDLVSTHDVNQASKNLMRQLVPEQAQAWCKPEFFVERGDAARRILDLAQLREPELIVLGAKAEHGVPGAATHLSNTVVHQVVAHADCPVLTIRS